MQLTKEEIDGIFQVFDNPAIVEELNREAKGIFPQAEQSQHFRSVVASFLDATMKSITAGGMDWKKIAAQVIVAFLLGYRHAQATGAAPTYGEPKIDPKILDEMIKHYEKTGE